MTTNETTDSRRCQQSGKNGPETTQEGLSEDHLLDIDNLRVQFDTPGETVYAINGIDLTLDRNETLGIVGESGSGKSVMALSLLQLLEDTATVDGTVAFDDENLLAKTNEEIRDIRGDRISMVFQDPGSSLNPVLRVGDQISETIRTHRPQASEDISWLEQSVLGNLVRSKRSLTNHEKAWEQTIELFERVGIPLPEQRALEYPHEFSGGMKQRALIAMAISCQPDLLICDEPTTALDVTIEAQILDLINELQSEFGTAVLFITHDMGVIHKISDRVAVMYAGSIVEETETEELFEHPKHPYTRALLDSVPRLDRSATLDPIGGRVPDLTSEPTGCPFAPRCDYVNDACHASFPPGYEVGPETDPLPVYQRGTDERSIEAPPPRQSLPHERNGRTHQTHCVLYGDADYLTTAECIEEIPGDVRSWRMGDTE